MLGVDLDKKFVFKTNPNSNKKGVVKHPFPTPITIKDALSDFVDLKGAVGKKAVKDLANYCTDEEEKQK